LSINAITKRYSKALVETGSENGTIETLGKELSAFNKMMSRETQLRLLLESPTLAMEKKAAILGDVLKKMSLTTGIQNFLGLVLENGRIEYIEQITRDYNKYADELAGRVRAKVTSAVRLNKSQETAVREALEKQTGKTIVLSTGVSKSLLGGLKVEIGGTTFDGSLKTQLKRIEDTLKKG